MKILYLYAEVMGYTMATIRELAERGNEVHVVHWDHKQLRLDGRPVVVGFDDQWHGTLKQWLAIILGRVGNFSQFYSHAWVAGLYQFEYARRLGFEKKNIVYDLYSADLRLFNQAYHDSIENKQNHYPHRFLFVGRFEPVKGLDVLLQAWQQLGVKKDDWVLHLIGNGSLKTQLEATAGVVLKDFMQPEQLMQEVANAGCFLLPSRGEPWGVVVHEFAAAGLPLIVSDVAGAASTFLISGLNGFSFKVNDPKALANRMHQIINKTDQELHAMAISSHALSQRITPETSAGNILSVAD